MNTAEINKQFAEIISRLKPYHPQKVILFGSYAWGHPSKESDVDLFIIKPSSEPKHLRSTKVDRLLYGSPFPIDALVYTPSEIKKRVKLNDFFIKRIIENGKVLYEKK